MKTITKSINFWISKNQDTVFGWFLGAVLGTYLFWLVQWNSHLYSLL